MQVISDLLKMNVTTEYVAHAKHYKYSVSDGRYKIYIRKLIKNNDYTIVEFSNKMCMSDSAIKNYLYGKVIPSVDVLHHMVRVFGLDSIEDILVFE